MEKGQKPEGFNHTRSEEAEEGGDVMSAQDMSS